MADITKLSDDELNRMLAEGEGTNAPSQSAPDISKLSDDELTRMLGESNKKGDRSLSGAAKRGLEEAALNAGALVSEVGKQTGYGGKQFPKLMAKVAQYLHDPNYVGGSEDIVAPGAGFGDRAAGVGRALIEGAPTLAIGALGGAPGMAAAAGTLGAGSGIRRVRAADQVPDDQALGAGQLGRVGASAAIDTLGTLIPAGKALGPIQRYSGVGQAVGRGTLNALQAAGSGAISNAAQTAIQKPLLEGELPSIPEVAAAGAVGGAAAGAPRAAREMLATPGAARWGRFGDQTPEGMAKAAAYIDKAREAGGYSRTGEGRGEDIRKVALAQAHDQVDFIARDGYDGGKNLIKQSVNKMREMGNTEVAQAYKEVKTALKKGEGVPQASLAKLKETFSNSNNDIGSRWVSEVEAASALGELGNIGKVTAGGQGRIGGIRATGVGAAADRISNLFGVGSIAANLAKMATGHSPSFGIGEALGLGATAGRGLFSLIDTATGYSNPVGRFAKRYGISGSNSDGGSPGAPPNPVRAGLSEPANAINNIVNNRPPNAPSPGGGGPVVSPLPARIAAAMNRTPRSPFPQMQGPPGRMPQDNFRGGLPGAPGAAQGVPASLPDPLTLIRARQALGQDNAPVMQDNARQFPAFGGQDNAPMLMQDNSGPTMVPPTPDMALPRSSVPVPPGANEGTGSPLDIALLRRMAPPVAGDDQAPPMAPPPAPEAPRSPTADLIDQRFDMGSRSMLDRLLERRAANRAANDEQPAPAPEAPMEAQFQTFPQEHGQYDLASKVDTADLKARARMNAAAQKMQEAPAPKPKAPPKEVKLEASVSPMEEVVSGKPAKASPMDEAVKGSSASGEAPKAKAKAAEDDNSFDAHGYKVSFPDNVRNKDRYQNGVMRRASPRKEVTDLLSSSAPKEMKKSFKDLYNDWMKAKNPNRALSKLEDLITDDRIPLETQSKLWDIWERNKDRLWNDWVEEEKK